MAEQHKDVSPGLFFFPFPFPFHGKHGSSAFVSTQSLGMRHARLSARLQQAAATCKIAFSYLLTSRGYAVENTLYSASA